MPGSILNIADIRKDYKLAALDEEAAGTDPISFFGKWFSEAEKAQITEVNAMTVSTVSAGGKPHARIVLLKGFNHDGFVFFTNYDSAKGDQLAENPHTALVFFWKELERQVRIEGTAEKVSAAESDAYFQSRPEGSRIGAWASPQSKEITDRHILDINYTKYEQQFSNISIPRPPYWGGYRIIPSCIEFWQGRSSRMHDRLVFSRAGDGWQRIRLAP